MTKLEAIYENGMFRPVSSVPQTLKEHERVRIIIEADIDENLQAEIAQLEKASDEDLLKFDEFLGNNGAVKRAATRIVDETFGSTSLIKRKDLISLAEDEEFSGY